MAATVEPLETEMTALALTRLQTVTSVADGAVALFRDLIDAMAKRRAFERTRDELSQLSDRELDDLGMSRWDIDRVARESVYGA
jgi:uncharacterized protein YjiS (DUF1127 family)